MMNQFRQPTITSRIVRLLALAGLAAVIAVVISLLETRPAQSPDPFETYDPATYGIPEILGGYRILTVQTLENTACMSPETMRLTVQAVDPLPDNPMAASGDGNIRVELNNLNPEMKWELQVVMPSPYDREQIVAANAEWNEAMKNGCINLGGPIVTPTDAG